MQRFVGATIYSGAVGGAVHAYCKLGEHGYLPNNFPWVSPSHQAAKSVGIMSFPFTFMFPKHPLLGPIIGISFIGHKAISNSIKEIDKEPTIEKVSTTYKKTFEDNK